ncbi:MAG: hypothetical protein IJZ32_04740 [Clostridia bacterium]|nr:hypothetical protein [Clostridia bacterium]
MDTNAEIRKEAESGFTVDLSALVAQALQEKREKASEKYAHVEQTPEGERLTWNATPEQVARINAGEREALDKFYFDNLQRLTYCAYRFMRNNAYVKAVASYEDLLQQVYFDLRTGAVKLRPYDRAISSAVFHSFRFAPVGGYDEVYIYKVKESGQCQRVAN